MSPDATIRHFLANDLSIAAETLRTSDLLLAAAVVRLPAPPRVPGCLANVARTLRTPARTISIAATVAPRALKEAA